MKSFKQAAAIGLTSLLLSGTAVAQTSTHDGAVLVFAPTYFSAFNPVTALDMVRQVPGFSIDNGEHVRGLADTFANVLVDGERQSTKSESINDILSRIPVENIERVELVREAVPGVDMRGQTRVANIVLREDQSSRSTTALLAGIYWAGADRVTPTGNISTTWDQGNTRFTLAAGLDTNAAPYIRDEWLYDANGNLIESRDERTARDVVSPRLSGSINTDFDNGARLNLSLSANQYLSDTLDTSVVTDAAGDSLRTEIFETDYEDTMWEGTLTYEHPLGENLSGQLVLLNQQSDSSSDEEYLRATASGNRNTTFFNNDVESGERAVRGTLTWEMNDRHSFEFGAESAFNYLENSLLISVAAGSTQPTQLPVSNTRIEEERSELFASHVWRPMDNVTVESGFRFERSTISQTGDAARERSFNYPKPSVTLTWNSGENTQWVFGLEREVGQLSFGAFASSIDPTDDVILIGNPELEPEKTWRAQAQWEHRWNGEGSLSVTLTHEEVEDVRDAQPVTIVTDAGAVPPTTTTFDAPGNIGDGRRTYLQIDTAIPLDDYGLGDSRLNLSAFLRDTEVTDPTTGEKRRFQGNEDWRFSANFRQNLTERSMSWGWSASFLGDEDRYRFDEIYEFGRDPRFDVWVETTAYLGATIRLSWQDLTAQNMERERRFFSDARDVGTLEAIERREQDLGGFVVLQARKTF
ncbi:outer membrane beta-barrel protein [Maricaulis sp.]|uniref:TonB-dependent receptor plug domain-containing protein n=1 Tax=Maricaulis sp. TaxID=1486257 RepID=UPI002612BC49|nr:outer membrane beta-barrel protein [Maricaulis sp.]